MSKFFKHISAAVATPYSRQLKDHKPEDFEVIKQKGIGHCKECFFNQHIDSCINGDSELVNLVFMQSPASNPPGSCMGLIAKLKDTTKK